MTETIARGDGSLTRIGRHLPAVLLLVGYYALAVSGVWDKSVTCDEIAHLTAGYSYWITHDYRLNPENGNLPQRWAALPLLLGRPAFPALEQPPWYHSDVWWVGHQFFYESGNDPDAMLFQGRVMMALLGVGLGVAVYVWSMRLFGRAGGLISLTLFAFCPTTLAHGALVTSDMAAALFFVLAVGGLWAVLRRVRVGTVLASSLAAAGLFLSKMSAVLLLPIALILILVRLIDGRPLEVTLGRNRSLQSVGEKGAAFVGLAAVHAAVIAVAIWASVEFRFEAFRVAEPGRDMFYPPWFPTDPSGLRWIGAALDFAWNHRLLPQSYLFGFRHALIFSQGRDAFLNGQYSYYGWPQFFPYCLLVKTPLPLFVLLGLAALATRRRWREDDPTGHARLQHLGQGLYATAPLWTLLAVYWAFAVTSHLNIGHRHLLPTYPPMYILAGAAAFWLRRLPATLLGQPRRWAHPLPALVVAGVVAVQVAEGVWQWPHYLAYFNVLAGGPRQGYRHLVDSSLDWGQDLPGLKRYLDERGWQGRGHPPVYLAYFGTGHPPHYRIDAIPLTRYHEFSPFREPVPLTGGVYCISATILQGIHLYTPGPWNRSHEQLYQRLSQALEEGERLKDKPAERERFLRERTDSPSWEILYHVYEQARLARLCAYLRQREPDDQVNYSILIYHLTDADVKEALQGPPPFRR